MAKQFRIYNQSGYVVTGIYDNTNNNWVDTTYSSIPVSYLSISIKSNNSAADSIVFSKLTNEKVFSEFSIKPYNEIYNQNGVLYAGANSFAVKNSLIAEFAAQSGGGSDATAVNQSLQITEAQTTNLKLDTLTSAVNNQKTGIDAQVLQDEIGQYILRRETMTANGSFTVVFIDFYGAIITPVGSLKPMSATDYTLRDLVHQAINNGADYNRSDIILETQILNLTITPTVVVSSLWYNSSLNTNISTPIPTDIKLITEAGLAKEATLQSISMQQTNGSQVANTRKFPHAIISSNQITNIGDFAANLDGSMIMTSYVGVYLYLVQRDPQNPFTGTLQVLQSANGEFIPTNAQSLGKGQRNSSEINIFNSPYFIPTSFEYLKVICTEVVNQGGGLNCSFAFEYSTAPITGNDSCNKDLIFNAEVQSGSNTFIDVENYSGVSIQFEKINGGSVKFRLFEASSIYNISGNNNFTETWAYSTKLNENASPVNLIDDESTCWLVPTNAKTLKIEDAGTSGSYRMYVYGHKTPINTDFSKAKQSTLADIQSNTAANIASTNAVTTATNAVKASVDNIGLKADIAATTDSGTFSLISFFKRYLERFTAFFTAFGTETSAAATTDTANTGFISLIKRALQRISDIITKLSDGTQKTQIIDNANVAFSSYLIDSNKNTQMVGQSATYFVFSSVGTGNSTAVQLAANGIFNGAVEDIKGQSGVSVLLVNNVSGTLNIIQYQDNLGTKVVSSWVIPIVGGTPFSRSFTANGNFIRVTYTNGAVATTNLTIDTAYGTITPSTNLGNIPQSLNEINGTVFSLGTVASTNSLSVTRAQNKQYQANFFNIALSNPASDIFTIYPNNSTRVLKIISLKGWFLATTKTTLTANLVIRGSIATGGTSTTQSPIPLDSANGVSIATIRAYTANPTIGIPIGSINSPKVNFETAATFSLAQGLELINPDAPVYLRGASQGLAINLLNVGVLGMNANFTVTWEEI